ncbi:MAG: toprim domain-containing protein [Gemmataceae bacterium]
MNPSKYVSVDDLQAQISLPEAAAKCGVTLEVHGNGRQVRLDCPFNCLGDHAGKRELSVDAGNPQKVFACHAYGCQVRGNLLMLMHGWLTGTRPYGDKLKGEEFKRVRNVLAGMPSPDANDAEKPSRKGSEKTSPPSCNVPLILSDNEKARELATLDEKFIRDVAHMPPAAASYVRRHSALSATAMEKWRAGVLPADAGKDKRGWGLRGQILYPVLAEDGKVLAWVARDPQFETKEQAFNALSPDLRAKEKKPAKHRFPVDFHRGLELFGQHAGRVNEAGYRELIANCGIIVVEGFNDVIGLDNIGVPAVAIMSNKVTEQQVTKLERWAKNLSSGKVTIFFDADDAGDEGAKEAHWLLVQRGLDVRLGWSRSMHGGRFNGRQPESVSLAEWDEAIRPGLDGR